MGTLKYLIIHCTDTPPGREVSRLDLERWHMGPRINANNTINYMGKNYPDIKAANIDPKFNGYFGRGWDRLGYSDIIHLNGTLENLTPYNDNNEVEAHEITWGASGVNSIARHVVYVGGKKPFGMRNLNLNQFLKLRKYINDFLYQHPDALIAGHNQFSTKSCPGFSTVEFCELNNIPKNNIYYGQIK